MTTTTKQHQIIRGANYRQISGPDGLLNRRVPFEGNSMSARYEDGVYIVYSYGTPIAWVGPQPGKPVYNDQHYSRTTSRHQNIVAAWL